MAESLGIVSWKSSRDDEGYTTYRLLFRVLGEPTDSLVDVMQAIGLPAIGSAFSVSGRTGIDAWCWCRPEMSVEIDQEEEGDLSGQTYYRVETVFSNKPCDRCVNDSAGNPLLEPMKISGSFIRMPLEIQQNADGARLVTSAAEPIVGNAVTFDYVRPTVRVEQNVASLNLSMLSSMVNTVNAQPLWGLPARCIKLSNVSWERRMYGTCNTYFTRFLEFEADGHNRDSNQNLIGFDREIFDSGSMVLAGVWMTDASDPETYGKYKLTSTVTSTTSSNVLEASPASFQAYKDLRGESARCMLDGHGRPANVGLLNLAGNSIGNSGAPARAVLKYYRESNFLLLGIPSSLS